MAGASATALAADRRTSAQMLLSEAARLEELAADERRVASQLSNLPASYSILHDLLVPGAETSFDHVVLGPGGVFLVVSQRYDGDLSFDEETGAASDETLMAAVRSVAIDARMLAEALATPVAPVLALVGPDADVDMPVKVEGVIVAPIDRVDRAVSRGSHTLLASKAIAEVSERAVPLLTTPAVVERTYDAPPIEGDIDSWVDGDEGSTPEALAPMPAEESVDIVVADVVALPSGDSSERRRRWRTPTMLAGAAVAAIGLAIFSAGSLISTLGLSTTSRAAGVEVVLNPISPSGTGAAVLARSVAAPRFTFSPVCPQPGAGWQLTPRRVDSTGAAAFYEVEARGVDGAWTRVGTLAAESVADTNVLRLAPGAVVDLRVTAVAADGRRSAPAAVRVTTPTDPC